jgi:thiamine kinase-like enzyme
MTEEVVAHLWKGYGRISRFTAADGTTSIIKRVSAPLLRAENLDQAELDDLRKRFSYQIEHYLYENNPSGFVGNARIAKFIASCDDWLEMEDLKQSFPLAKSALSERHTQVVLRWFAQFHATHFGSRHEEYPPPIPSPGKDFPTKRPDLWKSLQETGHLSSISYWETGSYWYLTTRLRERATLPSSKDPLKDWKGAISAAIDYAVQSIPRCFQTLIHGDAKVANVLFDSQEEHVAMYDFQYCGWSSPMRDVAAFLVTSTQKLDEDIQDRLLRFYHKELISELSNRDQEAAKYYSFDLMLEHYGSCIADFYRFQYSWGLWGQYEFAGQMAEKWIDANRDRIYKASQLHM